MALITRKGGAGVTIFVPYDCPNNCPFCINKAEYKDTTGFSLEKIQDSILKLHEITPHCDFVLTGGEPLANLSDLQKLLDTIPNTHKIFINTTLPTYKNISERDLADFLNENYHRGKIECINCSRHIKPYIKECSDEIFDMLEPQTRINCVVFNDNATPKQLKSFVDRFRKYNVYVAFRKDYVITTLENLYDLENDKLWKMLCKAFTYKEDIDKCRMRCSYEFESDGKKIIYHKTLPYAKIPLPNGDSVIYDIIIKQTGEIRTDWDICKDESTRKANILAKTLDLDAYRNVIFEEYQ